MGNLRIRSRQLIIGKTKNVVLIIGIYFLFIALFLFVPFILQFVRTDELWELVTKAAFLFVSALVLPFFSMCLKLGFSRYFFMKAKGGKEGIRQIFYYLSIGRFFRGVKFSLAFYTLKVFFAVLCFLPAVIMTFVFLRYLNFGSLLSVAIVSLCFLFVLFVICTFFYLKIRRLFFLSEYIFIRYEEAKVLDCFRLSVEIMQKNTGKLFALRSGFVLWFASCVFLLPIAYVWGYYRQTMAVFAQNLLVENLIEYDMS